MNRIGIISATQSIIIVAICAALGLTLAMVSDAEGASPLLSAIGGAVFGLVGVFVGFMARSSRQNLERSFGARAFGLRIAMLGFVLAIAGWLVGVFLSQTIGYWVVVVGVLTGCAGVAVLRFQSGARL
jgi:hypothetical protein